MAHDHAQGDEHEHEHDHDDHMHACIQECMDCHASCTMMVQYCIGEGGDHANIELVGVLMDAAEIAQASANFMLRGSPYHTATCAACAEVCRACEAACRELEDEQMQACADVCAACAESCEAMAAMGEEGEGEEDEEEEGEEDEEEEGEEEEEDR